MKKWWCHGCGCWVTREPWPHLDRRLLPMPLNQEEGIQDMRKFLAANVDKIDHEYAQGLLQELINKLEDSFDINTHPLIADIYEVRGE